MVWATVVRIMVAEVSPVEAKVVRTSVIGDIAVGAMVRDMVVGASVVQSSM